MKMRTTRLKLIFGVALTFTVAMADDTPFKINCSTISERLPTSEITPIKYDIKLIARPHQRILSGHMNILIDVKKPTRNISLHAISTRGYEAEGEAGSVPYKLFDFQYCEEKEILILIFNKVLDEGKYQLRLNYKSILNKNIEKIFFPTTRTSNRNQGWMLTNLYTPNAIRALFPCWDDPTVKATYNISIWYPVDYTVLSTIYEKSMDYIRDPTITRFGIKSTYYQELVSIPTYLIAFLMVDNITMDFEQRGIHYMWHKIDATKNFTYILERAESAIFFTYMHIGISQSGAFDKMNHVILPNSPMKSMSAPGLIVYREKDVTFDAALNFSDRSLDVVTLITYEMARQLFVFFVSPHLNADDVWLNEIFASFFSYYILDEMWASERLMELFVVKVIQPTLDSDLLLEREPIIHKAKNSDGIDALLYPLFYHKKAFALIRMLFKLYYSEIFKEAIKRYVYERTKDIWTILEEIHPLRFESNYTVKEIMNTWLTAKHHPELLIQRDYKMSTAACISSRTFVDSDPQWIIPVNYITESTINSYNISKVFWLKWGQVKNISSFSKNDFLIVNAEQIGYYRVNYDARNWEMISIYLTQHNFEHIPPISRAQLINDAYYFTSLNQLDTYIFVNITKFLKWDTDFIAWYPMFNILSYMSSYFEFPESRRMKEHFLEILDGVITKIGYEENSWDDTMKKSLRYLARKWVCKLGHSECQRAAFYYLMYYLTNLGLENVPAMSKEWIFCEGLKIKDLNDWEEILNKSMSYKNMELLEYLSCTENATIIVHYLTLMLDTDYLLEIKQSIGPMCRIVVKKHVRNYTVLRFVIDNYNKILRRFPHDFSGGVLLSDMIMNVYSTKQLDEIKQMVHEKLLWSMDDPSSLLFNILINERRVYLMKVLNKFEKFHSQF